ncbi:hypothetical protein FMUND_11145 [Fusarium mundagurra]|uniref:Uncharacterized protein n=1 Tax=Fusarium mundagurra TaxID=1567541 RepID=A0A8H5Y9U0_9HYPO|nr:hypothetical protein FMUND_11145 [Fusarium mundagurra]
MSHSTPSLIKLTRRCDKCSDLPRKTYMLWEGSLVGKSNVWHWAPRVEEAEQTIIAEVANALAAKEIAKASAEKASVASNIQEATKAAHSTAAEATKAAELATNEAMSLVDAANSAVNSSQSPIDYPWTMAGAADGSLIVGVRKQGAFGTQSASDVGLLKVGRYWKTGGFKNLAEGQSQWSHKDCDDFDQLLWVTKSQTKRKNTAINKKDLNADCCVKFHRKGIQIVAIMSLSKVLGLSSAIAEIKRVYKIDSICLPSDAGWVSHYYDPLKVEKDPVCCRALRDSQVKMSSDDKPGRRKQTPGVHSEAGSVKVEQLQDRVENLEN